MREMGDISVIIKRNIAKAPCTQKKSVLGLLLLLLVQWMIVK